MRSIIKKVSVKKVTLLDTNSSPRQFTLSSNEVQKSTQQMFDQGKFFSTIHLPQDLLEMF